MKKLIMIFVTISMLLLAGCSETIDYQTEPIKPAKFELSAWSYETGTSYQYLKTSYTPLNPRLFSLPNTYFMEMLLVALQNDSLILSNSNVKNAMINKTKVVLTLIEKGKFKAAEAKIENDLQKTFDKWIIPEHIYSCSLILEATLFYLRSGVENALLNVDYFDYLDGLEGYAWIQNNSGEKSIVFQLQGSKDNYYNDPIFHVLADLDDLFVDGTVFEMKTAGIGTNFGGCLCPNEAATCFCWGVVQASPDLPQLDTNM